MDIKETLQSISGIDDTIMLYKELIDKLERKRRDFARRTHLAQSPKVKALNEDFYRVNAATIARVKEKLLNLQNQKAAAVAIVDMIEDETARELVRAHYIDGVSLFECTRLFYYSDPSAVRKKIKRALEKEQKQHKAVNNAPF